MKPLFYIDQKTLDFLQEQPLDQVTRISILSFGNGIAQKGTVPVYLQPKEEDRE